MNENKTMKYDQGLDGGGDVTNNTEYPHLHNHSSSQNTGILSFWDLFAITLQLSERVCQRLSSAGTSGCPSFWNLDPSELSQRRHLVSVFTYSHWNVPLAFCIFPPNGSSNHQVKEINSCSSFCLCVSQPPGRLFAIYSWIHCCRSGSGPHGVHFKHSSQTSIFLLLPAPLGVLSIIRHECNHNICPL